MKVGNLYIEDTYAEAFTGIYSRFIVTTHPSRLNKAKEGLGLPSVVVGRTEGGVEKWLGGYETPDGRTGFIAQVWGMSTGDMEKDSKKFYKELCIRIRQGILVVPTTKIYNACDNELIIGSFDMMDGVGYCGDKYSREVYEYGRRMINVPIMFGEDFRIEKYLGYCFGISGGNIWYFCENKDAALKAGELGTKAVLDVEGAITPFDDCSAGSKPAYDGQPNVEVIGPSTNHEFCPTLRGNIFSKVPEGLNYIPEIVINSVDMYSMKSAMKAAIEAVKDIKGIRGISAGNYGGKLGRYKIYLRELF